jgi:hypothetical protein
MIGTPLLALLEGCFRVPFRFPTEHSNLCIIVVRRRRHLLPRPLSKQFEKAGDVLGDLPGVLTAEVTPEPWLPHCDRAIDQIVVGCS